MSLGAPRSEESVKASRTGMLPRWFLERSVQRGSAWDVIVLETCPECHPVPSPDWFGSPQRSRLNVWIKVFLPASDREARSKGCFMSSVRTVCGDTFKPISTQHRFCHIGHVWHLFISLRSGWIERKGRLCQLTFHKLFFFVCFFFGSNINNSHRRFWIEIKNLPKYFPSAPVFILVLKWHSARVCVCSLLTLLPVSLLRAYLSGKHLFS